MLHTGSLACKAPMHVNEMRNHVTLVYLMKVQRSVGTRMNLLGTLNGLVVAIGEA
jgi:hypothetical protein